VEYEIEEPSNKLLALAELDSDTWAGEGLCMSDWEERLLFPFLLSSTAEKRGMTFAIGLPRVALADSLTRGYCLKPLWGF